ncbi:hypothetical protein RhiirA5_29740 [Rhizophagus irregularis]|uniref:Uncharacterized protein n=1 Tax=Rhizophagus irregularis TaxID=588596 RepID=A0A2N0Q6A1_9GLOM|nr:hypothetical protein RhiirA5_29740 [Rhizophagus irregularis]
MIFIPRSKIINFLGVHQYSKLSHQIPTKSFHRFLIFVFNFLKINLCGYANILDMLSFMYKSMTDMQ